MRPSYAALRRGAGKPVRERQQDEDEGGEYRDGGEDAADEEIRRLLEQAEDQPRRNRAAVVAHAAERDRHEAVEGQQWRVGEEGKQQLPASAPMTPASAKLAIRRLRSGSPSARAA